jgi:DNA-directed RNA polymerase specialized sigma24 family protein
MRPRRWPLPSEALDEKKYQHVVGYLRRRNRDPSRAEEPTPDVFAAAAAELPDAREGDPALLTWLYAVARRRFVEETRRKRREKPVDLPEPRGSLDYGPFVARALEDALRALPRGQSRVIALKLLRGLTFAEIGREVGLTEDAAKLRFRRALEALRDEFIERGTSHAHS